jgi:hypothetical protein
VPDCHRVVCVLARMRVCVSLGHPSIHPSIPINLFSLLHSIVLKS